MNNPFFDHPILNSPYARPMRHWELDESGGGEVGAARTDNPGGVGRNVSHAGGAQRHDVSVAGVEAQTESLDEHLLGHDLYDHHSCHDVELGFRHILRNH